MASIHVGHGLPYANCGSMAFSARDGILEIGICDGQNPLGGRIRDGLAEHNRSETVVRILRFRHFRFRNQGLDVPSDP